jgi:hypothetical protein
MATGHRQAEFCALLNVADAVTTATLCTRAFVAAMVSHESNGEGSRDLARAVMAHAPEEPFVLVSMHGGPPNGDALSNISAVLAVAAARAAAQ